MAGEGSGGIRPYPQQDAAEWEVAGAIADIATAGWGVGSAKSAERQLLKVPSEVIRARRPPDPARPTPG
jgi:hypothetical protein